MEITNPHEVLSLLTAAEVSARVKFSRVHIYRLIRRGQFPRPMKLGPRRSAWLEEEISEWVAGRKALRDSRPQTNS